MSALPETLKSITATKIDELKKQREIYETAKRITIETASREPDLTSKVEAAINGLASIEGVHLTADDSSETQSTSDITTSAAKLKNQQRFIRQAKIDPSFAKSIVKQISAELSRDLELGSRKHEYAEFFSALVTEWLSNKDEQQASKNDTDSEKFETVGRKEMHEQRAQWESLVFTEATIDEVKIKSYLERLFTSDKTVSKALDDLRKATQKFSDSIISLDTTNIKTYINGVLKTDLLSEEKRAILKTFLSNKDVLTEVADVLNMRMRSLPTWSWSTGSNGGIKLEQRKQLNSKYRVFMDEDVLDAIMLHTLGVQWAVHFKSVFTTFFHSEAWQRRSNAIPHNARMRREYFLGEEKETTGIEHTRRSMYAAEYFMTQLPITEEEGVRGYDSNGEEEQVSGSRKSPLDVKHSLLHLLITESLLSQHLQPEEFHTVIRSDFKWFGPSLPHASIFTVLKFLGVSDFWLSFFKQFLAAPLCFVQDGLDAEVQIRTRGVPMSHSFSDVFGEVVMFCLDFSVNLATGGSLLYRLHDDFWFWGSEQACQTAWSAMTEFAETMGIEFNMEKTGTVRLGEVLEDCDSNSGAGYSDELEGTSTKSASDPLPEGEIRWGFVQLDPTFGKFIIDQEMVDKHVKELQIQLSDCNSVFAWIQAYNTYLVRFFTNNFGKPSYGFGRQHVDSMIETFARVQKILFPNGSVTDYLRNRIEKDFGVTDLPDGIFYWPINLGGLELRNPFVPLFSIRENLRTAAMEILSKTLDEDIATYASAEKRFKEHRTDKGLGGSHSSGYLYVEKSERDTFMSKEEFLKYREETSNPLSYAYEQLLMIPEEASIHKTPQISSWLDNLPRTILGNSSGCIRKEFVRMEPYWKWMVGVHGAEMAKKYGGLQIVESGKVPVGIVGVLKQGKVRWTG